jgi:hypothetical protein
VLHCTKLGGFASRRVTRRALVMHLASAPASRAERVQRLKLSPWPLDRTRTAPPRRTGMASLRRQLTGTRPSAASAATAATAAATAAAAAAASPAAWKSAPASLYGLHPGSTPPAWLAHRASLLCGSLPRPFRPHTHGRTDGRTSLLDLCLTLARPPSGGVGRRVNKNPAGV